MTIKRIQPLESTGNESTFPLPDISIVPLPSSINVAFSPHFPVILASESVEYVRQTVVSAAIYNSNNLSVLWFSPLIYFYVTLHELVIY